MAPTSIPPEPPHPTTLNRESKKWITVGGSPVHVDASGKIIFGCPGLKGVNVASLIGESQESRHIREVRQDHAEARSLTGRDVSPAEVQRLASPNKIKQHEVAKQAARGSGHSTSSVLRAMSDAHQVHADQHQMLRPAINRAMKLTGVTPAKATQWEDRGNDWSTWPDFDHWSRAVAAEHPELGLDRDDHDTPARIWDLIRDSGKRTAQAELHSPEVARTAVAMLGTPIRANRRLVPQGDAFEFDGDTRFDPDRFRRSDRIHVAAVIQPRLPQNHRTLISHALFANPPK